MAVDNSHSIKGHYWCTGKEQKNCLDYGYITVTCS